MSKTILITGTSSGFGKLTAITLADKGHRVIAAMRDSRGKNLAAAEELNGTPNIEVIEMDVTNTASVNSAVEKTLAQYGVIDVLVNNAGVTGSGVLEATSIDVIKALFEVNYFGLIRLYQAVLPGMRKNKSGLIINISSGLGLISLPYLVAYNSSKFALEALTEGIRTEVKRFNIENVSIQCGPYPTGIAAKSGYNADKTDVIEEYGSETHNAIQRFGGKLFAKITEYQMNPQAIADGVLELVEMPDGERPFQFPIDAIVEGADRNLIAVRNDAKGSYIAKYEFEV